MLNKRKFYYLPLIAMLAFVGLVAFHSPVYAEDTNPPVAAAAADTQPAGSSTGSSAAPAAAAAPAAPAAPAADTQPAASSTDNPAAPAVDTQPAGSTVDNPAAPAAPAADTQPAASPTENPVAPAADTQPAASPTETPAAPAAPAAPAPKAAAQNTADTVTAVEPKKSAEENSSSVEYSAEAAKSQPVDNGDISARLVVLDQSGDAISPTTQAAADALAAPDPYFYVGITKYQFTTADCDPGPGAPVACGDPIQAAFNYIKALNINPVGGTVYVEAGTYNSNLVIDG
ncbi:MAG TPA: hypothetical protein VF338_09590, partial [Leptolinea sp.]